MSSPNPGSLACVGTGITLGSHISPIAKSHIQQADVVFAAVADELTERWLREMHADVRSLQYLYGQDTPRLTTYRAMVDVLLMEVRAGKRVCGVFYGHPGVFAWAPHKAIAQAREEGFSAIMEPGISSEDCLYADLGIDPGAAGCQHYETSQFMIYERTIDTSAWLILWQIGLAGDFDSTRFDTSESYLAILCETLYASYGKDHSCIVYQAPTLPFQQPKIENIRIEELPHHRLSRGDTLAIPPSTPLKPNMRIQARLSAMKLKNSA